MSRVFRDLLGEETSREGTSKKKKEMCLFLKGMNTKIRVGVDEGGVKYTLRVRLDEE